MDARSGTSPHFSSASQSQLKYHDLNQRDRQTARTYLTLLSLPHCTWQKQAIACINTHLVAHKHMRRKIHTDGSARHNMLLLACSKTVNKTLSWWDIHSRQTHLQIRVVLNNTNMNLSILFLYFFTSVPWDWVMLGFAPQGWRRIVGCSLSC